jgi:plasmid stability protein
VDPFQIQNGFVRRKEKQMAINLSIKGVPDEIAERLRERAARNHRSLQGELMAIVSRAAAEMTERPTSGSAGETGPGAGPFPSGLEVYRRGTRTIDEVVAELRRRLPKPLTDEPRSVDIVREARDSR